MRGDWLVVAASGPFGCDEACECRPDIRHAGTRRNSAPSRRTISWSASITPASVSVLNINSFRNTTPPARFAASSMPRSPPAPTRSPSLLFAPISVQEVGREYSILARPRLRLRRWFDGVTCSASGRRPSAEGPVPRRAGRSVPGSANAASGWRLFRRLCNASLSFHAFSPLS